MSESEQAREAILAERLRRGYEVIVQEPFPARAIGGIRLPEGSFQAETHCTVHEHPHCQWTDWAVKMPDGSFRVIFWNDLIRPERTISRRVQQILSEEDLTQEGE